MDVLEFFPNLSMMTQSSYDITHGSSGAIVTNRNELRSRIGPSAAASSLNTLACCPIPTEWKSLLPSAPPEPGGAKALWRCLWCCRWEASAPEGAPNSACWPGTGQRPWSSSAAGHGRGHSQLSPPCVTASCPCLCHCHLSPPCVPASCPHLCHSQL